jgi:hypothetical protein
MLKFYLNLARITGPLHEDQYRFFYPVLFSSS